MPPGEGGAAATSPHIAGLVFSGSRTRDALSYALVVQFKRASDSSQYKNDSSIDRGNGRLSTPSDSSPSTHLERTTAPPPFLARPVYDVITPPPTNPLWTMQNGLYTEGEIMIPGQGYWHYGPKND